MRLLNWWITKKLEDIVYGIMIYEYKYNTLVKY